MAVRIAAFGVAGQVGHHAKADQLVADEAANQRQAFGETQLNRKGHLKFPGDLGVLAFFGLLNLVP